MRVKPFFVSGIRDWLQTFAGYEIKNEQTSFGILYRTAKQLRDAGNDLNFSRDTGFRRLH